jgi:hypothetical protein
MVRRYSMLAALWAAVFLAVGAQPQAAKALRATHTSINAPTGLALDGRGHLFVIEREIAGRSVALDGSGGAVNIEAETNSVMSIDLQKGTITTVAGYGKKCCYRDGEKATAVSLGDLSSITTDALGNILLGGDGRIRKIDMASGTISTVAGEGAVDNTIEGASALSTSLRNPVSLAVDTQGDLFVVNYVQIVKLDMDHGTIHLFAGNGQVRFSGDEGPAVDASLGPNDSIAFDRSGNLLVSDHERCRIRRIDHTTGRINTIAVTDQLGAKCPTIFEQAGYPGAVASDPAGNIYFVESSMDLVVRIAAQTSTVSIFAGTGKRGFRGDGGPATRAELAYPKGLAVDADGNVFIGEEENNRIRRVDSKTGIITTVGGNGWPRRY